MILELILSVSKCHRLTLFSRLTMVNFFVDLQIDVLNGIAWDEDKNRIFGKLPRVYLVYYISIGLK